MVTTYYVDPILGNDAGTGADWANAWKTLAAGPTAARTAPGDTIKIAKSPAPVSLGINGQWTKTPMTFPAGVSITSSTNTSPIQINKVAHGFSTGDIVYIAAHTSHKSANGTWRVTRVNADAYTLDGSVGTANGTNQGSAYKCPQQIVGLASAPTAVLKIITRCQEDWTASGSATVTADSSYFKDGYYSAKIVKAAPANNTLYAYRAIGGGAGVDYSAYQRVTFWIRNATAITAGQWKLCLCSDAAGTTIVDTIAIPAISSTNKWVPLVIVGDNANLGNSIQSVALYSGASAGATTGIQLNSIIACTTAGLNLTSLISKNTLEQSTMASANYGNESWYCIQSIGEDGMIIHLDKDTSITPNDYISANQTRLPGYGGTTESVNLYYRETSKVAIGTDGTINETASAGNVYTFTGGWNPATGNQDGETIFDNQNSAGYCIYMYQKNFIQIDHVCGVRASYGMYIYQCADCKVTNVASMCGHANYGISASYYSHRFELDSYVSSCNIGGQALNIDNFNYALVTNIGNMDHNGGVNFSNLNNSVIGDVARCYVSYNYGITIATCTFCTFGAMVAVLAPNDTVKISACMYVTVKSVNSTYSNTYGLEITTSYEVNVLSGTLANNNSGGAQMINRNGVNYVNRVAITGTVDTTPADTNSQLRCTNYNNTPNDHRVFTDYGTIVSDASADRHTLSGICWKMSPTNVIRSAKYPLKLQVITIACAAGAQVTLTVFVKKTHATDIGAKFVVPGGQLAGMTAADYVVTKANDTSYESLQIQFTPAEAGVIEAYVWAYWLANTADESVFVDDVGASQA